MKLLIALVVCFAASSAKHFYGADVPFKYTGPLNLNTRLVDHPNGAKVPADEPAVATARAAHLSSKAETAASVGAAAHITAGNYKSSGAFNLDTRLVDFPNGAKVPADEPAVVAARAAHLSSKAETAASVPVAAASSFAAATPFAASDFKYTGPLNLNTRLVDHPNGAKVPVDEPAVATARAAHLSSKAAIAASVPVTAAIPASAGELRYTGPLNLNTITRLVDHSNGAKVPADEPAVAAARAAHLSSKAAIVASVPVAAAVPVSVSKFKYTGPLNLNTRLVDHPNGAKVPADEPAVAAARAAHLSSKASTAANPPVDAAAPFKYTGPLNLNTRLVDHPNGAKVPADESAVVAARAAHLSSKAAIAASVPVGAASPFAAAPFKYTGPINMETRLVDHPNGAKVPADEPAVAAARAAHLSSKVATAVSSTVGASSGSKSTGAFNLDTRLVDFPNGAVVPAYEPVVAAARSSHLKAKAAFSTASISAGY